MMIDHGKSDNSVLPRKSSNKVRQKAAERMEGWELAKGKTLEQTTPRTQGRRGVPSGLERIREAAQKDRKQRFTALLHHAYAVDRLRESYFRLEREAAPGIDGETWRHYGEKLEENLEDLSERVKRVAYRARPVQRVYIPKADGRQRPIGVPVLEDKIVQRAVAEVAEKVKNEYGTGPEKMADGRKDREVVRARSVLCYQAVRKLRMTVRDVALKLGITHSAVSKFVSRGERLLLGKNS